MPKLLFLLKNFRQGWGGGPESVRLMAHELRRLGFTSDVLDRGRLHRAVEDMALLPVDQTQTEAFAFAAMQDYAGFVHVGPWQDPRDPRRILRRRRPDQPYYYLPRGGLAPGEFAGARFFKKIPYYLGIERIFIDGADGIVFSSQAEAEQLHAIYRSKTPKHVIPDYFVPQASAPGGTPRGDGAVVLGFLAEISPRKGLLPFAAGLSEWARRHPAHTIVFRLGGAPRRGEEGHIAAVMAILRSAPANLSVETLGAVAHGARPAFYAGIDIFAAPSLFESFCLTALEALAAGCTSVCAPNMGVLEFLPPARPVCRAADYGAASFADALDAAWSATSASDAREQTSAYAASATAGINRLADIGWSALLQAAPPVVAASPALPT